MMKKFKIDLFHSTGMFKEDKIMPSRQAVKKEKLLLLSGPIHNRPGCGFE
jgi:hypothetical protein